MVEIRFVHTSDWHLGYTQYNKIERNRDFKKSALELMDKIIDIKPDFVLHTGDVFHYKKPSPSTIIQAVEILSKLKKQSIPIYVVRGNHDEGTSNYETEEGGVLKLLDELNLINYIDDDIIHLAKLNVKILGVGYYSGKKIRKKIWELVEKNQDFLNDENFKIIAIHGFVQGQPTIIDNDIHISMRKIKDLGVDYFGAGHYHIPWKDEINKIYAPGSLECTKISDAYLRNDLIAVQNSGNQISMHSSFFEINKYNKNKINVKEHQIKTRPKILLNYESDKSSIEEVRTELDGKIELSLKKISEIDFSRIKVKPILNIKLDTNMTNIQNSKIKVVDWYQDEFLHVRTKIDGITNQRRLENYNNSENEKDILKQLLEKDPYFKIEDLDILYEIIELKGKITDTNFDFISKRIDTMNDKNRILEEL